MKDYFLPVLYKICIAMIVFLMPVAPLLYGTMIFCVADVVTGVAAAYKRGGWEVIKSRRAVGKVIDIIMYLAAIILSYYFGVLFGAFGFINLSKMVAFIIVSIEFWSNLENISSITGIPLNKKGVMDAMAKFKSTDVQ
jgi:ABC-type transport system involved in cytochrome bd biosynthesis fused ATPase/permease subunit